MNVLHKETDQSSYLSRSWSLKKPLDQPSFLPSSLQLTNQQGWMGMMGMMGLPNRPSASCSPPDSQRKQTTRVKRWWSRCQEAKAPPLFSAVRKSWCNITLREQFVRYTSSIYRTFTVCVQISNIRFSWKNISINLTLQWNKSTKQESKTRENKKKKYQYKTNE